MSVLKEKQEPEYLPGLNRTEHNMLYNICSEQNMLCYIKCVMLCYITCVMLCYITKYVMLYNMLYNMCYVMLYNMCHVMLSNMSHVMLYKVCHVILYNICHVMLYNMLCSVMFILRYRTCYVYVMLYLTIIPRGHVGYEMIDSQRGA